MLPTLSNSELDIATVRLSNSTVDLSNFTLSLSNSKLVSDILPSTIPAQTTQFININSNTNEIL